MMHADTLLELLEKKAPLPEDAVVVTQQNMLHIHLPIKSVISYIKKIKKQLGFDILSDLFAADFPERSERFEIVYNLLSIKHNARIIVKTCISKDERVPSLCELHSCAIWYEREVYDMFGVEFLGNKDLRRILTDYGFVGHPLRKDFPLTGYTQVTYDEDLEQVIYEPVKLAQEYRDFDFTSPWQGPNYALPGDEKATNKSKISE